MTYTKNTHLRIFYEIHAPRLLSFLPSHHTPDTVKSTRFIHFILWHTACKVYICVFAQKRDNIHSLTVTMRLTFLWWTVQNWIAFDPTNYGTRHPCNPNKCHYCTFRTLYNGSRYYRPFHDRGARKIAANKESFPYVWNKWMTECQGS